MYQPAGTGTVIQVLPQMGQNGACPLVSATNVIPFTVVVQVQIPVHVPNAGPHAGNPAPPKEWCAGQTEAGPARRAGAFTGIRPLTQEWRRRSGCPLYQPALPSRRLSQPYRHDRQVPHPEG